MLRFSFFFLFLAVLAAVLGFTGMVAGVLVGIAKVLFFLFLVLWLATLFGGRRRTFP